MSTEQWVELQEALKDHPDLEAELQRVARHMAFKDSFERFEPAREEQADPARPVRVRHARAGRLTSHP